MVASTLISLSAALALAVPATASPSYGAIKGFQFPDAVPIEKRQVSGPQFECHSACGNTILESENAGYCDSSEWRELLDECLICVEEFPIWQWYGEGVQGAAAGCDLSAEPGSPATPIGGGDDDEEEEEEETTTTTSTTAPPVASPTDSEEEETTTTTETSATETPAESSAEESTYSSVYVPSPVPSDVASPSSNQTIPEPSHVETDAGVRLAGSGFAIGVGALVAALFMM